MIEQKPNEANSARKAIFGQELIQPDTEPIGATLPSGQEKRLARILTPGGPQRLAWITDDEAGLLALSADRQKVLGFFPENQIEYIDNGIENRELPGSDKLIRIPYSTH